MEREAGTREAEVLGFRFSSAILATISDFGTVSMTFKASVNRANSGLSGGVFMPTIIIAPTMDDPNEAEAKHNMNLALRFLAMLEDYALQNLRLKTFILSLPMAEESGFSLDDILYKNEQCEDSERDLRARYDETRSHLLSASDYQAGLKRFLKRFEASNGD